MNEILTEVHPQGDYQIYSQFTMATEVEMGHVLYGLVRQLKPQIVFEDGAGMGHGTLALARACKDNQKGHVVACENRTEYWQVAVERVKGYPADVRLQSTPCDPTVEIADFIFADGEYGNRIKCFERAKPGCVVVMHDTTAENSLREFILAKGGQVFMGGRGFGILIK